METVGIVGGLGTETSCSFCFNVNSKVNKEMRVQPNLLMDNVPVPRDVLEELARGNPIRRIKDLLSESIERLNKSSPSFIVIPCNTVHVFIDELREESETPILSIIEETVTECSGQGFKKIGILGSSTTTKSGLYSKELRKKGIEPIEPNQEEQKEISEIIIRIVNVENTEEDNKRLLSIIQNMRDKGAEAVILGCTDLFLTVGQKNSSLPIINSTEVLEKAVIKRLTEEEK